MSMYCLYGGYISDTCGFEWKGEWMNVSLFVVIDEDNLYRDCVGSVFSETKNHIWLDLGDDRVQFFKTEVQRIN